jgi:hypothetical protein
MALRNETLCAKPAGAGPAAPAVTLQAQEGQR